MNSSSPTFSLGSERRIVVLGAGYGGLRTALKLERKLRNATGVRLILVDRNDYHQYLHNIHEVTCGRLSLKNVMVPLARLLRNKKIEFIRANVTLIDPAKKVLESETGSVPFDTLTVAVGSETSFYGIEGLERYALTLKSVDDSTRIYERVREVFSSASNKGTGSLRFIVGGGGFTGVELAGEFAEALPLVARRLGVRPERVRVVLVEAMGTVLPGWNEVLSRKALDILHSMDVDVILGQRVMAAYERGLVLKDGRRIEGVMTVWTGGVKGFDLLVDSGLKVGKGQRAIINEYCEAIDNPNIYVIGDCAIVPDPKTGEPLPPSIQVANQQADLVVENIYANLTGRARGKFKPKYAGEVVSIGRRHTIGKLWEVPLTGIVARLIKRSFHVWHVFSIGGLSLVLDRGKF